MSSNERDAVCSDLRHIYNALQIVSETAVMANAGVIPVAVLDKRVEVQGRRPKETICSTAEWQLP